MESLDDTPLTKGEIETARAKADKGETPSLSLVRRFILTIRKNFTASPKAVEKAKVTRNKKAVPDEKQIDFF